ncbi:DNA-binding response OmpR family regulator [Clostridium tetanomorphum]|uniref:Stage 0 sporulation protein A homolog n=1 Tax=Clostridium tetanomorphum TaxID=1553 RepID=A0A923J1Z5_CLOTT|nr:response regulator transcription factor [Clostridium tetanomorphum]KAJ48872.1 alkaline phosphatase synthesis transcriptional regulatory proteinphop [Clostridium tetanomorphum DSM 665]KAJ52962.1 alkaline phosphatase synthesis transcriptional regulatory proteinphop [Clostridium tetanomorphum DSM 665]MBC2398215.1 response regulator transcription factor [Clostridium tetanomorphum]MBP1864902.1 DNA-binding response OmpR family regulator [Clostridium tetanomorphum]NRS83108.1 DNA-binding response O
MKEKILLIDDEVGLVEMLELVLKKEGFIDIKKAYSGEEALKILSSFSPDIIILDVMLPDTDGFQLCTKIRDITTVPIIFLTARTTELDKLMGLGIGGDDYITKPFNPLEVVARIKAQLRRIQITKETILSSYPKVYDYKRFKLNVSTAQLFVEENEIECPAKEFELLTFLCAHPNRIFSTQQLYEQVWGEISLGDLNTVMVHMLRLRKKIEEDASKPQILVNVRGLGYKFVPPEER